MVSALDSKSRQVLVQALHGQGDSGDCVVFLDKTLYPHSALSTQVYKWFTGNLMLGGTKYPCDGLASHPGRSTNKSLHAIETGISSGLMGH